MANVLLDGMEGLVSKLNMVDPQPLDDKVKAEWNKYVDWLDTKGMKGKPELDTDKVGFKYLEQYRKENPNTILTPDLVLPIQQEFQTYRTKALENIKAGKAKFDGTDEQFMPGLSKLDGYPGRYTTSYKFPGMVTHNLQDGVEVNKTVIPFAPTNLRR